MHWAHYLEQKVPVMDFKNFEVSKKDTVRFFSFEIRINIISILIIKILHTTTCNLKPLQKMSNVHLRVNFKTVLSGLNSKWQNYGFVVICLFIVGFIFTWVGLIGGGGALRFFGVPLLSELILETWSCWKSSQSKEWRWVS